MERAIWSSWFSQTERRGDGCWCCGELVIVEFPKLHSELLDRQLPVPLLQTLLSQLFGYGHEGCSWSLTRGA
jgi:hypothetical protein